MVQSFISEPKEPESKELNEANEAIATGDSVCTVPIAMDRNGPKQGPGVAISSSGAGTKAAGSFHHSVSGMPWT